ncbi:Hpt domain-containing protein [Roseobacter sinensis]|uniref:Hpt domain-containing protein n=1 Tax=Roseobacter sinensis TaxID=2931391 RepID=A0ABT3B8Y3_9RHOB|nr:Hpt domain-containing protein [Roseobacter sp. WL0113]MCV3270028.1 Hpt domain-containing protein [Roseobacter sp. WL0113]
MIDWDRVATLKDEVGAEDFDEVVDLFLEEVDSAIDALAAQQQHDDLEAKLHFLKGSALSLGFRSFSDLCQAGEAAAASTPDAVVDLNEILQCYAQSRAAFLSDLPIRLVS